MDRIDDELDSLRLRAYGPDADIWSDAAALARLRELEAEAHRAAQHHGEHGAGDRAAGEHGHGEHGHGDHGGGEQEMRPPRWEPADVDVEARSPHDALEELFRVPAVLDERAPAAELTPDAAFVDGDDARRPDVAPSPEDDSALPGHDASTGSAAQIPPVPPPSAPPLSRRKRVAWTLSLVAAVALTAGFTAWLYPYGVRDGLHHDARLQVQSEGASEDVIAQLGTTDPTHVRYFGEYKGLPIYATTDCLQAVMEPNRGAIYGGCAVDGIDPILDLYVPGAGQGDTSYTDMQFPRELTRDFPDGGLVRFQLDGDEVLVDEGRHPKQA